MDWTRSIDGYCERTDPGLWAEPVNAVTNLAFLIVAVVMWRRSGGQGLPRLLSAILFAIGVGSGLFHTFATVWAATADVLPIVGFVLVYIFAINRAVLGWPIWGAAAGAAAFLPYSAALAPLFRMVPAFEVSAFYWPLPVLILGYAVALRRRYPALARGLAIGAGLLVLSLTFRSLDEALCDSLPLGTHFLWHLLNAAMLGWMIEVLRRHLEAPAPGG
jgi:hypothetical protein